MSFYTVARANSEKSFKQSSKDHVERGSIESRVKNQVEEKIENEMEVITITPSFIFGSEEEAFSSSASTHFLSKEELERFHYSDPIRLLQSVPGVHIQEEEGFGLRPNLGLRGATPHRSRKITLMEDGVLVAPAPYAAPAAYFFPNMMRAYNVEISKGVTSVKYGPNSIGGAINFVTHPIEESFSQLGLTYGRVKKYEFLTVGMKTEAPPETSGGATKGARTHPQRFFQDDNGWGYLIEYNRAESEGFKKLPHGESTGFEKNDFMLKGQYEKGPHRVLLKTSYSNERSHETYLGLAEEDFKRSPLSRYVATARDLMVWDHKQYQVQYLFDSHKDANFYTTLLFSSFQSQLV